MTKVSMTVNGKAVSGEVEGRTLLSAFSRRNEQQPPADRTLGRRLQYEAFVDGDYLVGGRLPDFLYAWLK